MAFVLLIGFGSFLFIYFFFKEKFWIAEVVPCKMSIYIYIYIYIFFFFDGYNEYILFYSTMTMGKMEI